MYLLYLLLFGRNRLEIELTKLLTKNAIIIQKWYRLCYNRMRISPRTRLMDAIRPVVWYIKLSHKIRRRRQNASIVCQFFQDYSRQAKLKHVLQQFRIKVVIVQRFVKAFLKVQKQRRMMLHMVWETLEASHGDAIAKSAKKEYKKSKKIKVITEVKTPKDRSFLELTHRRPVLHNSKRRRASEYGNKVQNLNKVDIEINSLVRKVVWKIRRVVGASSCILYIHNPVRKELTFRLTETSTVHHVSNGRGIAGVVSRRGQLINCLDAFTHPQFDNAVDRFYGVQSSTLLAAPVMDKCDVIAVLQMAEKTSSSEGFSESDENLLKECCKYLSKALAVIYSRVDSKKGKKYRNKFVEPQELELHRSKTVDEIEILNQEAQMAHAAMTVEIDEYLKQKEENRPVVPLRILRSTARRNRFGT